MQRMQLHNDDGNVKQITAQFYKSHDNHMITIMIMLQDSLLQQII